MANFLEWKKYRSRLFQNPSFSALFVLLPFLLLWLATINRPKKGQNQKQNQKKLHQKKKKSFYMQNTAGSIKIQQTTFDIKKKEEPRPRYLHSCRCSSSELTHRCQGGGQKTWSSWPQRRERERENEEKSWALGSPWAGVNSQQCLWWGAAARFWGVGAERAGQQQQISRGSSIDGRELVLRRDLIAKWSVACRQQLRQ